MPAEDRNRTSPFPYGGHRFEFRAVGSSQNVSMVNTVLCTAMAEQMDKFAEAIEKGTAPLVVAQVSTSGIGTTSKSSVTAIPRIINCCYLII